MKGNDTKHIVMLKDTRTAPGCSCGSLIKATLLAFSGFLSHHGFLDITLPKREDFVYNTDLDWF